MSVKKISVSALMIALITITTMFIAFPIGIGYLNISDALVMLFAACIGSGPIAFLVGAIGCALADLLLGYGQYAVFTFIIKGIEALIVLYCLKKLPIKWISFLFAGLWMAFGYGMTDAFLSSNIALFIPQFLYNCIQGSVCAILALVLHPYIKKIVHDIK